MTTEEGQPLATLECVVLDCPDPGKLAAFYRSLPGGIINQPNPRWAVGDRWATLHTPTGPVLAFQAVDRYVAPRWPEPAHPQQFHLDLHVGNSSRHTRACPLWAAGFWISARLTGLRRPGRSSVPPRRQLVHRHQRSVSHHDASALTCRRLKIERMPGA